MERKEEKMTDNEIVFPRPDGRMEHVVVKFRIGYGLLSTTVSIKIDDPDIMEKIVELFGMPGLTQCYINNKEFLNKQRLETKNL